ncbi:MAG: lysophospholipase [Phycisphaerales bacterium]|nr:lysophospholipase [Phycisphaerales bacterium]
MKDCIEYYRVSDGTRLAVGCFQASRGAGSAGPVVLMLHGIASHMGWYSGIAQELQSRGVSVYVSDRRGVARSEGARAHASAWAILVDDLVHLAQMIEQRHPAQPLHAMGISLGGAIAVACAILHPGLFRSLVLLSPALASSVRVPLKQKLATLSRAVLAPTTLVNLPFGVEQLTTSALWREVLEKDQHRTRQVSARFLLEFLRMQRYIRRNIRHMGEPVIAFFGASDEIIDNDRSIALLNSIQAATVRVEVFEEVSHMLAAALPRRQLAQRLVIWLNGDIGSNTERFSLLRTVLSHPARENDPPPSLSDDMGGPQHAQS